MTQRYQTTEELRAGLFEVDWVPLLENVIPDPNDRQRAATALSQLRQAVSDLPDLVGAAENIEYVYANSDLDSLPDAKKPLDTWGYLDPGTVDGLTWTSAQTSTTTSAPYTWRAERMTTGAPAMGDMVNALWSDPIIIIRPSSGLPGPPGRGFDEVFAITDTHVLDAAKRPSDAWGYAEGGVSDGLQWDAVAPEPTAALPFLWRARRPVEGAPDVGDAVPGLWREPRVISHFGIDGGAGVPGEDGQGYEYIFTVWEDENLPVWAYPNNAWGYDQPGTITDPNI